ncbi:hypothetical protein ACFLUU_11020, partial [Chloroflexota bacterium]
MKAFKKTIRLVLAISFAIILAQSIFNYTFASVGNLQPYPDAGAGGDLYTISDSLPPGDLTLRSLATEYVYGTAQSCTFTITNPSNSIDAAFDNTTASAVGDWDTVATNNWTFATIQDTTLTPTNVTAEVRFYTPDHTNDAFTLDIYDGTSWSTMFSYNGTTLPNTLTTVSYNATSILNTQVKINAARIRFYAGASKEGVDTFTIYVDGVRLVVTGTAAPGAATLKQAHYRIGDDTALAPMTWKAAVDTTATGIACSTNFRVRFQVYNDGTVAKSWQPQLEWSATSGSGYAAVPTSSGSDPFSVNNTAQFTNADTISTTDFGCGSGTGTAENGTAYDTENPAGSSINLTNAYYTEIEFNIQANSSANYSTFYYFRLTNAGTAFDAYDVTEAVITMEAAPGTVTLGATRGAATLKQAHYRIGNDKPLSAMTWKHRVDQTAVNILHNTSFRVHFQVYNDSTTGSWQPQLEWSATSGSGYAAVPTSSEDDPFFVNDTAQFTNADTISTADFGCGSGTGTAENGTAYDTENPAGSSINLTSAHYTEIEFNIQANSNANYSTLYYFRLTNAGTAFGAYDVTEAVIEIQPQPSTSDPHNTYLSTTDKCASCHRTHLGS